MMKKLFMLLGLAALGLPPCLAADASSLFSPEPPDPGAAALVDAYLPLLAAGQYEQALDMHDMRGMRQYLLDRRLAELKAKNSEMTAQDLEEISAQLQVNDLNPARLQDIMLSVLKEANHAGMTWKLRGYAPAPPPSDGFLASFECRSADGKDRPLLLGIRRLGDQWKIAPYIVEAMASQLTPVRAMPRDAIPREVLSVIQTFWTHWQNGEMNEAYSLFSLAYRSRMPLLAFLQQTQEFITATGVPVGWSIVQGVESAPSTLWLGVTVRGSIATRPTLMSFRKTDSIWLLEDLQLQMPRPHPPADNPSTPPPGPRNDLHPDLKPSLEPLFPPAPEVPAEPAPAPPQPAQPAAPVGPAQP